MKNQVCITYRENFLVRIEMNVVDITLIDREINPLFSCMSKKERLRLKNKRLLKKKSKIVYEENVYDKVSEKFTSFILAIWN